jgi:hypothetical protein
VAAEHEQVEGVVVGSRCSRIGAVEIEDRLFSGATGALAAPGIHQSALGDDHQPGAGVLRDAVAGPVVRCGEERLLDRVLRRIEVTGPARQRAEDLRRQLAQQVLDVGRDVQEVRPTCSRKPSISVAVEGP